VKRAGHAKRDQREATSGPTAEVAEEDTARADIYALLGRLLLAPPKVDLLAKIGGLEGDDSAFGAAVAALGAAAKAASATSVRSEYEALFIGTSQGELQPYGS
jgi:TorA maturation chaperone TorD